MRSITRCVVTAAMLVLAAGCASSDDSATDHADLVELFLPWSDPAVSDRLSQEYHDRGEEVVATCMAEAGFEYIPVPLEAVAFGPGIGISREENARRFGFGRSTSDLQLAAGNATTSTQRDPNEAYVDGLTDERSRAYSDQIDICQAELRATSPPFPDAYRAGVSSLADQVRADPAVAEAERAWVDCVAEAAGPGLPDFSTLDDLVVWFDQELERVKENPEQLARLQDLERAAAVANLSCEPALVSAMREVAETMESDFIAANRDLLDRHLEYLDG